MVHRWLIGVGAAPAASREVLAEVPFRLQSANGVEVPSGSLRSSGSLGNASLGVCPRPGRRVTFGPHRDSEIPVCGGLGTTCSLLRSARRATPPCDLGLCAGAASAPLTPGSEGVDAERGLPVVIRRLRGHYGDGSVSPCNASTHFPRSRDVRGGATPSYSPTPVHDYPERPIQLAGLRFDGALLNGRGGADDRLPVIFRVTGSLGPSTIGLDPPATPEFSRSCGAPVRGSSASLMVHPVRGPVVARPRRSLRRITL